MTNINNLINDNLQREDNDENPEMDNMYENNDEYGDEDGSVVSSGENGEEEENENEMYENEDEDSDMGDMELEFLRRVEVGKGAESIKKQIHMLTSRTGLFLPKYGLARRDLARLGLGLVKSLKESQVKHRKFEVKIPGCTDRPSLIHWLLNNPNTRKYMFTKLRTVKGTDDRREVPTNVSYKYLVALALNVGKKEWAVHQKQHLDLKLNLKGTYQNQNVPKFMKKNPKQMTPSGTKKSSTFSSSLAKHMDREIELNNNELYKVLFKQHIVTSTSDFKEYLEKIKSATSGFTGKESVTQVNQKMIETLEIQKKQSQEKKDRFRKSLSSDFDIQRDKFVDYMVLLGFDDIKADWVQDFELSDFKAISEHLEFCQKRIENSLVDQYERQIAIEFLKEQLELWFENRDKE